MATDPACLYVDIGTPEGQATGLLQSSVISCLLIATIDCDRVDRILGTLSAAMRHRLSDCVKAALEVS